MTLSLLQKEGDFIRNNSGADCGILAGPVGICVSSKAGNPREDKIRVDFRIELGYLRAEILVSY